MKSIIDDQDIPLAERLQQKKNGYDDDHRDEEDSDRYKIKRQKSANLPDQASLRRANKNRPLELTSKRAVGRYKEVIKVPKKHIHDPRFDPMCGRLNEDLFTKAYAFVDEYKEQELKDLKAKLKKSKDPTKKDELKNEINILAQDITEKQRNRKVKDALTKRKRDEREAVANGKLPFYLKRKDKKNVELQAKYESLKESGKLSKFMAKKRKKNANKDHRWLPTQRKDTI